MEKYTALSYQLAEQTTKSYSTSFSMSTRLFPVSIREHIYALYGLVRIADEIVDTYMGPDTEAALTELESQVLALITSDQPFSPNPIVHAFVVTARAFSIDSSLIQPFFDSMRTDIAARSFTQAAYQAYIYGSAEVIGLMCLKVFTNGDADVYNQLAPGAMALGRAYQKVNFLRDMKSDYQDRGRVYFPGVRYENFDDTQKQAIEQDIEKDFIVAREYIPALPTAARRAIQTSDAYYWQLFMSLKKASAKDISSRRIRVHDAKKLLLFAKAKVLP
jgi:phytoene/squalene synthetase